MKRSLLLLLLLTVSFSAIRANINLVLDYSIFYLSDQNQPYVEFYLSVNGKSLYYNTNEDGLQQAQIEITYLVEDGDKVVAFEKFQLNSPFYTNEDSKVDLMDLKRVFVPNGNYTYTLIAKDLISGAIVESSDKLRPIAFNKDSLELSEIELSTNVIVASESSTFQKNGYDIFPSFTHFFGKGQENLYFYMEIYNSSNKFGDGENFLMEYSIVNLGDEQIVANLRGFKRMTASPVIPVIQSFGLEDLPTGKYDLLVNVKNRENELVASKKIEFHRSNPTLKNYSAVQTENTFVDSLTNQEELAEYIRCLGPISSAQEVQFAKNQVNYGDIKLMQQYFLNFWKERNLVEPGREWSKYKAEVEKVDMLFGYGKTKGYRTERGRVYLHYGPPSAMQNVPYQRDTYPYSVWQYYKLNGQANRKFIFYSPSMEMLGYEVLHSNVPGEIKNPNWEIKLVSKGQININNAAETPQGTTIQEEARDLYDNPR